LLAGKGEVVWEPGEGIEQGLPGVILRVTASRIAQVLDDDLVAPEAVLPRQADGLAVAVDEELGDFHGRPPRQMEYILLSIY